MFRFGKKNKPDIPMDDGFKGQEVSINPSAEKKKERNRARLERVLLKLAELKKKGLTKSKQYEAFKAEAEMRKAQLKFDKIKGV